MNSYAPGFLPTGGLPENVPEDRVFDIDLFNLQHIDEGYQEAIMQLQRPDVPKIVWTPKNGGHWIVTRAEAVREVLRNPDQFTSEVIVLPKEAGEKYDFIPTRLDPPHHGAYRSIINRSLNIRQMRHLESKVRETAIDLIEPLVAQGHCDFTKDYAEQFPIRIFMSMVDLPLADAPILMHYATQILRPAGTTGAEMAESLEAAIKGFYAYLDPVLNARRGKDGTDMISSVINSDVNGDPMIHSEALNIIANLLLAGLDTVVSFLSFVMIFLGRNPSHLKQLVDDPELIPRAVEELLRRFPIVADGRMVAADMHYDGVTLRKGDMVQVPTAYSGLDPALNDNPWTVDFHRRRPEHNTFGDGPHRCAGMHLARLEITITLQEWLSRIPVFRLATNAAPQYSSGMVATVKNVPLEWEPA